jgi:hypothetical protein
LLTGNNFFRPPRVWEWNLALQQTQGRDQTLSLDYAGAAGRKLLYVTAYPGGYYTTYSVICTANSRTSDYNALEAQKEGRVVYDLAVNASYTWSQSIDTNSSDTS